MCLSNAQDSAKNFAISGLSVVGRDYYGVFPLRGKPLNVREATAKQLVDNGELNAIKRIVGLQSGKIYDSVKDLRYGRLLFLTDADVDGSHISGLLLNMLHFFWPSLLSIDGFASTLATPIIKVSRNRSVQSFFTMTEYHRWKDENDGAKGYHVKYFKGLSTSTAAEARGCFEGIDDALVRYVVDDATDAAMALAFDKTKADDRKGWLMKYDADSIIEQSQKTVTVSEFVDRELIHFSQYDNRRSIPSMVDGLKPSQRKVLFTCLKKNLREEAKVAQLAALVASETAYAHGETSLQGTIIGMAQDFVGAGNVNLLTPNGSFGTRLQGGKDAGAARYIFTQLHKIAADVFHPADAPLLTYLDDDGFPIEPEYYVPVVPLVLFLGCTGIGTGFSTSVPQFDPRDVVANLRRMLDGDEPEPMVPFYRGFTGSITATDKGFVTTGTWRAVPGASAIEVTELPIGSWTESVYKEFLEASLIDAAEKDPKKTKKQFLLSYENYSSLTAVRFVLKFPQQSFAAFIADPLRVTADLHLTSNLTLSNMHLFDARNVICKYATTSDILRAFYDVRLDFYGRRRTYLLRRLARELAILRSKIRFIEEVMAGDLIVFKRPKEELLLDLGGRGYMVVDAAANVSDEQPDAAGDYSYLLSLNVAAFTQERIDALQKQTDEKDDELRTVEGTSDMDMWRTDLSAFESSYVLAAKDFEAKLADDGAGAGAGAGGAAKKKRK